MPKIQREKKAAPERPRRRLCMDPMCKWPDGGECEAQEANASAVDAEQFVWIRQWDACPAIALAGEREAWDDHLPPHDDLPDPILDLNALQVAFHETGMHPGEAEIRRAADFVAAYLKAVEFGA